MVYENMGNGADQPSVLEHRRAGISLYDAAGFLQQPLISNFEHKIFVRILASKIDFRNLRLILFYRIVHAHPHGGRARLDLLPVGNFRHGKRQCTAFFPVQNAVDTVDGILRH